MRKKKIAGIVVLACALTVIVWKVAGLVASRPGDGFDLSAEDFDSFVIELDGWHVEKLPVVATHMEPNILRFLITGKEDMSSVRILVRLVHGFNMRDCMRIKGYSVDEVDSGEWTDSNSMHSARDQVRTQLWRVTSGAGDSSLWLSGVLRARDFSETGGDIRDMPFPRVGIPDDPNWIPRGLTLQSLRHPVRNFRYFLRSKWNASRCDLLTFMGLRRPSWASEDLLTFLVVWGGSVSDNDAMVYEVLDKVYLDVLGQLQDWEKGSGE